MMQLEAPWLKPFLQMPDLPDLHVQFTVLEESHLDRYFVQYLQELVRQLDELDNVSVEIKAENSTVWTMFLRGLQNEGTDEA